MSFGSPTPIEVAVQGASLANDYGYAQKIQSQLAKLDFVRDLQFAQEYNYPTLDININRERAGQFGLTMADVVRSVVPATSSSRFTEPNYWRDPNSGNAFQIQVELPQNRMQSVESVGELPIMLDGHRDTELTNIAQMKLGTMPGLIERFNGQHIVSLTANIHGITLGEAAQKLNQALAGRRARRPRGVKVVMKGEIPPLEQTISGLRIGLLLAVVVIFLLLSANFQSMRLALAIVLTVPAVLCGVLLMLRVTEHDAEHSILHGRDYGDRHCRRELDSADHVRRALPPREQARYGCGSRGRLQPAPGDPDDGRGDDFRHAADGDRIWRGWLAIGAAGPRRHRRSAPIHLRDFDHPSLDLRHPASGGRR